MATRCDECGAAFDAAPDSCAHRFDALLALDHSRQEPWGSRHGQAFAAFALQHPGAYAASLDRAWAALYRIYVLGASPAAVFGAIRRGEATPAALTVWSVPPRPARPAAMPAVTIADLGDFAASTYAERLDAWCRATLDAWAPP